MICRSSVELLVLVIRKLQRIGGSSDVRGLRIWQRQQLRNMRYTVSVCHEIGREIGHEIDIKESDMKSDMNLKSDINSVSGHEKTLTAIENEKERVCVYFQRCPPSGLRFPALVCGLFTCVHVHEIT